MIQQEPNYKFKDEDNGRQRMLLELEFVQFLANPNFVHYLAQNRYFEDEAFTGYLKYLLYWKRPEYIKFIMYPHCLFFLDLLQNPDFRKAMAHPANKELALRQQFYSWKHYRNNRLKHIMPEPVAADAPSVSLALANPTIVTHASAYIKNNHLQNSSLTDRYKKEKEELIMTYIVLILSLFFWMIRIYSMKSFMCS